MAHKNPVIICLCSYEKYLALKTYPYLPAPSLGPRLKSEILVPSSSLTVSLAIPFENEEDVDKDSVRDGLFRNTVENS